MNDTGLLILERMARRLGVPSRWLREEAIAGRVPCLMAGGRILFSDIAVSACLRARAGETVAPSSLEGEGDDHVG